ncbi:MAG: hypothetical protein ACE5ES_04040 [Candidatus Nanoarchaeia archaeon]
MPNREILEGIRMALSRGESLRQAMISFQNSGYPAHEIQEAARALQMEQAQQRMQPGFRQQIPSNQPPTQTRPQQPLIQPKPPQQQIQQPIKQIFRKKQEQKVSAYGQHPKQAKKNIVIILALVFILLLLIGGLVGFFIFKDSIIGFFNTTFN